MVATADFDSPQYVVHSTASPGPCNVAVKWQVADEALVEAFSKEEMDILKKLVKRIKLGCNPDTPLDELIESVAKQLRGE